MNDYDRGWRDGRAMLLAKIDEALNDNSAMVKWSREYGVNLWRSYPEGYLKAIANQVKS